jgi:hypothetical protein
VEGGAIPKQRHLAAGQRAKYNYRNLSRSLLLLICKTL